MSRLDDELRNALRPTDPAPDFTDRVLARLALTEGSRRREPAPVNWLDRLRRALLPPGPRWALAASFSVLLVALIGWQQYQRQQRLRAEGESAKAQVIYALGLASAKLNIAQRKILERQEAAGEPRRPSHQ